MGVENGLTNFPIPLHPSLVDPDQLRSIPPNLVVRNRRNDAAVLECFQKLGIVVVRFLVGDAVVGIARQDGAVIVCLHVAVGRTGALGDQDFLEAGEGSQVQAFMSLPQFLRDLCRPFPGRLHVDYPGVRLPELFFRLPSDSIGNPSQRQQIALVGAVRKNFCSDRHGLLTVEFPQSHRLDPAILSLDRKGNVSGQKRDPRLGLDHLPDQCLDNPGLELAVRVARFPRQGMTQLRGLLSVGFPIMIENGLAQLVVDRRAPSFPDRVPNAEPTRENPARMIGPIHENDIEPFSRRPHRTSHSAGCRLDHAKICIDRFFALQRRNGKNAYDKNPPHSTFPTIASVSSILNRVETTECFFSPSSYLM